MIKSPSDITYGTKSTRLDQRSIDVMLEMEFFNRLILAGTRPQSVKVPKPEGHQYDEVSFVEQVAYECHKQDWSTYDPRVVPFYTRAKEPIVHILIPEIAKQGLYTQIVEAGAWTSVNIISNSNSTHSVAESIHADYTMAVSVAALKALIRTPSELANKFSNVRRNISR